MRISTIIATTAATIMLVTAVTTSSVAALSTDSTMTPVSVGRTSTPTKLNSKQANRVGRIDVAHLPMFYGQSCMMGASSTIQSGRAHVTMKTLPKGNTRVNVDAMLHLPANDSYTLWTTMLNLDDNGNVIGCTANPKPFVGSAAHDWTYAYGNYTIATGPGTYAMQLFVTPANAFNNGILASPQFTVTVK